MAAKKHDFDADGKAEILVTNPRGIGVLKFSGTTLTAPIVAANGTRFSGGWLLDSVNNRFDLMADFDGDGKTEILITSPWGLGILDAAGGTFTAGMMAPNKTRFSGGWILNTLANRFGPVGDFDGDGKVEILVTSSWGLGIFKLSGNTITVPVIKPNGTRFGGWLLNTADNHFSLVGDMDGDGKDEILVTSPWGMGILKLAGNTLTSVMMARNGTQVGGWSIDTADNYVLATADLGGTDRVAEIMITSPKGMAILRLSGNTLIPTLVAQNGASFGSWRLNTLNNRFGPVADFDNDGKAELLATSPSGLAVLKLSGSALTTVATAQNGANFGGWTLNTATNHFDDIADFTGDDKADLLVSSPTGIGILRLSGNTFQTGMTASNGARFGNWTLNTGDSRFEVGEQTIRLHVKVLADPFMTSIDRWIEAMQQVFEPVGIRVHHVSTEKLDLPELRDLDVFLPDVMTSDQNALYAHRNNAWGNDIVVYVVRMIMVPMAGWAPSWAGAPKLRPGMVILTSLANRWALAHHTGHLLGLAHVTDSARLMNEGGLSNASTPVPMLIPPEVNTIRGSTLTFVS